MNNIRQLTSKEVIFVGGETSSIYQHTGGLIILDPGRRKNWGFEQFRKHTETQIGQIPQFRWRLHQVPLGLDLPYWVKDEQFNIDRHVRKIAVPSPGDDAALAELVGFLYSKHMDRNHALWEAWFIEGLAGGRYAVFHKVHHCLMDGQGAARLMEYMFEDGPRAKPRKLSGELASAEPGEIPETWRKAVTAAWRLYSLPLKAGLEINDIFMQKLWKKIKRSDAAPRAPKPEVTNASFNTDVGADRGIVFASLPLADIKAVKTHFDVTINDVMLALVSGSLRDYLQAYHELPDIPIRTFIAVSLRQEGDAEFSNKVTTAAVTLATDVADPQERLRAIAAESQGAKEGARGGGKGAMEIQQMLPPFLNTVLALVAPPDKIAGLAGANLLVSNVRTSPKKMYLAGARVEAIYPMSIVGPGLGVNVTCIGYADNIDVGITLAPELFPECWELTEGMQRHLKAYVALTKKKTAARKPAARRTRKNPVRKSAPRKRKPSGKRS